MKVKDLAHETNTALSANKGRSVLTILGIVIGIMAVVIMVSIITGFETWLEDNMGLNAARVITVTSSDDNTPLQYDDAAFLKRVISDYDEVLPEASTTVTVASQVSGSSSSSSSSTTTSTSSSSSSSSTTDSSSVSLSLIGVDPEYFDMEETNLKYGSFYTADAGMAIVVDENTVEDIYGDSDYNAVGQSIEIGNNKYEIVGITESASSLTGSTNKTGIAYIPYSTMTDAVLGSQTVDELVCQASASADVSYVASQTEGVLAARHSVKYDDDGTQSVYTASTAESALENLDTFIMAFDALAALVAGIALLVGGIGIMNMMLTNVSERIREIGLRKSLGARPRDITLQFLSESVALCITGGIVGTIAGIAGAWGITSLVARFNSNLDGLTPVISPLLVLIVFLVCAAIGIIFGYYPARRAAKLNPAETLRYQ